MGIGPSPAEKTRLVLLSLTAVLKEIGARVYGVYSMSRRSYIQS